MADDFTNENEKKPTENDSSISSELIRGHINTIILRTLYDGDKYGYEIINEIEDKSKGQYTLKQPTLYSALKRLESQDFVTSYWGGVSNGGRRKYFQITEKGRKIVEQNLAEWEYSRTIIDSLISEKDYDFSNPPPASSVDFSLLKKSTTRVPAGKGEGDEAAFSYGEEADAPEHTTEEAPSAAQQESASGQTEAPSPAEEAIPPEDTAPVPEHEPFEEDTSVTEENVYAADEEPHVLTPEEQQRIHENYRALIGESSESDYYTQINRRNEEEELQRRRAEEEAQYAEEQQRYAQEGAYAQQADSAPYDEQYERNRAVSSELLYANRPPEERNYKELIARLYDNTRHDEDELYDQAPPMEEPTAPEPQRTSPPEEEPAPEPPVRQAASAARNIEFYDVEERAENEGLRVTTATGRRNTVAPHPGAGTTFDKGRLLFITALWVFGVAIVESIINACLINVLGTNAAYVALPFVFAFIMLAVFLLLFMRGYGKNSKKVKTKSYVSATLIIYVNVVLIICLIAFLVTGFSGTITVRNIFVYAILPCIYLFNIPLFAIIYYYLFSKE